MFQVKWAADNLDGYLNFYSVSGDGRVSNWTIVKTALWTNDTLLINFCKTLSNLGEESVTELLMGKNSKVDRFNTPRMGQALDSQSVRLGLTLDKNSIFQTVGGRSPSSQMMTAHSWLEQMKVTQHDHMIIDH